MAGFLARLAGAFSMEGETYRGHFSWLTWGLPASSPFPAMEDPPRTELSVFPFVQAVRSALMTLPPGCVTFRVSVWKRISLSQSMDVHCSTCREPWDVDYLRHEAIFDIGLSDAEARAWRSLPREMKLNDRYRDDFKAGGWDFGNSVLNVLRCPACPPGVLADPEIVAIKSALEDVLGDDEDGLAATLEDFNL